MNHHNWAANHSALTLFACFIVGVASALSKNSTEF